jgi:hypothetical protein
MKNNNIKLHPRRNRICGCGLDFANSDYNSVVGCFECSNEPSDFINGREFL